MTGHDFDVRALPGSSAERDKRLPPSAAVRQNETRRRGRRPSGEAKDGRAAQHSPEIGDHVRRRRQEELSAHGSGAFAASLFATWRASRRNL